MWNTKYIKTKNFHQHCHQTPRKFFTDPLTKTSKQSKKWRILHAKHITLVEKRRKTQKLKIISFYKKEKKIYTSGEGFDETSSSALEIPKNLFNGAGIILCARVHCFLRCSSSLWKPKSEEPNEKERGAKRRRFGEKQKREWVRAKEYLSHCLSAKPKFCKLQAMLKQKCKQLFYFFFSSFDFSFILVFIILMFFLLKLGNYK